MPQLLALAGLLIASGQSAAAPSQAASTNLVLEIGVYTYRGSDRRGFAGNHGLNALQSYAWGDETLCSLAASSREPSQTPGTGWHFSGRVLKRTGDDFLVDIEWSRLWDRSTRLTDPPKGSMQVTLRAGDRLSLDDVTPAVESTCQIAGARLEAAVVAWSAPVRLIGGTGSGSGARTGSAGAKGAGPIRGQGRSGSGAISSPAVADGMLVAPLQAEVWLVHKLPSGTEEVQRLKFAFGTTGSDFAFPPIEIGKDADKISVDVTGRLRAVVTNGQRKMLMTVNRTAKRDRAFSGGSAKIIDLPENDEVLSFELPTAPPQADPQALLAGHQFSLRLRVTAK